MPYIIDIAISKTLHRGIGRGIHVNPHALKYTVLTQDCDVPLWLSCACLYLIYLSLEESSEMNSAHSATSFVYAHA
jgi:hypothetical protein